MSQIKPQSTKSEQELHAEIMTLVKEWYKIKFSKKSFNPGETYINYAGRIFDEKELLNLVDSSLEFWLTSGQ